jgi:fructoselysine-6-P-deglycase FrlB-like protein
VPTLGDVAAEVQSQPAALNDMMRGKLAKAASGSIFVGAGDSYASALAAQYLSKGRVGALDPYALASSPSSAAGRDVYFITISGRTRTNVAAARRVRRIARRTFAITSEPRSPIVDAADHLIELPYSYVPRIPGTLSFTLSLLAAIKLSCGDVRCDFARLFSDARLSPAYALSPSGTTYFLGNGPGYAAALYSSLKVLEVLGSKANAEFVEEFGHAVLFSLGENDAVNISTAFDPEGVGKRLASALRREGFIGRLIPDKGRNEFESVFHSIFSLQVGILREARRRKITSPYILRAGKKLGLSDSMIY